MGQIDERERARRYSICVQTQMEMEQYLDEDETRNFSTSRARRTMYDKGLRHSALEPKQESKRPLLGSGKIGESFLVAIVGCLTFFDPAITDRVSQWYRERFV
jgi:hypothetical protein